MHRIFTVLVILTSSSCSVSPSNLDKLAFRHIGGTLFSTPTETSLKAIHLDNGSLLGQEVITKGSIAKIGAHTTHLIISDHNARMLILLTDLTNAHLLLKEKKPKVLKVLGTVERGKRGLPFIQASALNTVESEKT